MVLISAELKQLGSANYVFPDAVHTRFQHSLGVGHLAGEWMSILIQKSGLNQRRQWLQALRDSVVIAGLCHDIGHGPCSHDFEMYINKTLDPNWSHEEMGSRIFDYLIDKNVKGVGVSENGLTANFSDKCR